MKLVDRLRRKRHASPGAVQGWEVQGVLLPSVTRAGEYGYGIIQCTSEKEADAWVARLYRDHGPGMIRVDKAPAPFLTTAHARRCGGGG